jgi:hypothetical protein
MHNLDGQDPQLLAVQKEISRVLSLSNDGEHRRSLLAAGFDLGWVMAEFREYVLQLRADQKEMEAKLDLYYDTVLQSAADVADAELELYKATLHLHRMLTKYNPSDPALEQLECRLADLRQRLPVGEL